MKYLPTIELITPVKAKKMIEKNPINRPINEENLNKIIAQMKRGKFHFTGESIKISENGNLLDGQHRLMSIINTGVSLEMLVVRNLPEDSFKYMDTGRTRKPSDVLGIQGVKHPNRVASMIVFILNFDSKKYSNAGSNRRKSFITNLSVSEFAEKHNDSILDSMPFGFNKENRLISGTVLSSFHFIFKRINVESANDFCWKLANGESLTKGSPIHLLRQKFINDIRVTRRMNNLERLALICKAWNLYRENKTVSILKWDIKREPFPTPK